MQHLMQIADTDAPPHAPPAIADLSHLQAQIEAAKLKLAGLQRDLFEAEASLSISYAAQLLGANEQLTQAALDAHKLQLAAEQARRRQIEFLAVLAHELRNPLGPIRNVAALLKRAGADDMPRLQAVIERQVVHLAQMVNDLLDLSRANVGKLRLHLQPVDMAGVLDAALDVCLPAMQARQQIFECQVCAGTLEVQGDLVRLTQVVSNLLDNASRYTPQGGAIGLKVERAGGDMVMTVSDEGIGITAQALPHIFDAFLQDTRAAGFNGAGLGIGLTVVRELVERHGGTVAALSAGPGRGSRFVVRLALNCEGAAVDADRGVTLLRVAS